MSDGWITSVYLDNDAHDCYHTRLARSEGASITRIRWYGADAVPPPKAVVFVERKTHHDKAVTDEASVKERFPLRCGKVADLLGGGLDVPAYAALQVASGDMTEKQAANLTRLATEVAADVGARRLHACVRTVYKRAAFQLATSNDVRISLAYGKSRPAPGRGPGLPVRHSGDQAAGRRDARVAAAGAGDGHRRARQEVQQGAPAGGGAALYDL